MEPGVDDLRAEFSRQLDLLKDWFGDRLALLQAENAKLKQLSQQPVESEEANDGCQVLALPARELSATSVAAVAEKKANAAVTLEVSAVNGSQAPFTGSSTASKRIKRSITGYARPPLRKLWEDKGNGEEGGIQQGRSLKRKASKVKDAISRGFEQKHEHVDMLPRFWIDLPLKPASPVRLAWDCLAAWVLLFDVITIPLRAFAIDSAVLIGGARFVLCYWTFDMLMSCITCHYTRKGELVTSWWEILKKYLTTWCVPDILIVGTDWVTLIFLDSKTGVSSIRAVARGMRVLRLARMLRLVRLVKLKELIMKVEECIASEYISIIWGVCSNVFILLMLNHICACIWFLIGSSTDGGWVEFYGYTHESTSLWTKYIISLHWSLAQFTPASMMVQPQTDIERSYAVSVLIVAMVTFSHFISSITAGMTRLRAIEHGQVVEQFRLRKFLKCYCISPNLQARIMRYIDIAVSSRRKVLPRSEVTLLKYLSGPLNIELLMEMYLPYLQVHPYFWRVSSNSVIGHMCCAAIDSLSVSQGDTIFSRHRSAGHFYILHSGSTAYKVKDSEGKRAVRVPQGAWFSEAALWVNWHHQGKMQALTECSLLVISSEQFGEVVVTHFKAYCESRAYAKEFVEALHESLERHGTAWDVPDHVMYSTVVSSEVAEDDEQGEVRKGENLEVELMLGRDDSDSESEYALSISDHGEEELRKESPQEEQSQQMMHL